LQIIVAADGTMQCFQNAAAIAAGSLTTNSRSSACIPCPHGSFSDQAGASSCDPCPVGTYSHPTNRSECISVCPAGTYRDMSLGGCILCSENCYQPAEDAASCIACPANSQYNGPGSTSLGTYLLVNDSCLKLI
jgi:hypothetical protein